MVETPGDVNYAKKASPKRKIVESTYWVANRRGGGGVGRVCTGFVWVKERTGGSRGGTGQPTPPPKVRRM